MVLPIVQPSWRGEERRYIGRDKVAEGLGHQARKSAPCWADQFLSNYIPRNTKGLTTQTGECSILSP